MHFINSGIHLFMLQTNCLEYNLYKVGHVLNWVIGLSHRYLVFLTLRSMAEPVSHLLEFCFVCSFVFKILRKNTIFPYIDRSKATKYWRTLWIIIYTKNFIEFDHQPSLILSSDQQRSTVVIPGTDNEICTNWITQLKE